MEIWLSKNSKNAHENTFETTGEYSLISRIIASNNFYSTISFFHYELQSVKQLEKKIQSHLRTAIWYGIGTGWLADEWNLRLLPAITYKRDVNIISLIDTGKQCTIAGMGKVFEKFLETGKIKDFTGFGLVPAKYSDEHFSEAPLRVMSFAESYSEMQYTCKKSNSYLFCHTNTHNQKIFHLRSNLLFSHFINFLFSVWYL